MKKVSIAGKPLSWFGPDVEDSVMEQSLNCLRVGPVHGVSLMADNHQGYAVPIGGVVAYRDAISPSGVGFDIGCGVKAIKTDLMLIDVLPKIGQIVGEINDKIEFGMGRRNDVAIDHPVMDSPYWVGLPQVLLDKKRSASVQLGTVGAGNHYVDVLSDVDTGEIWIACHFGSRGFGHGVATYSFARLSATDGIMADPCVVDHHHPFFDEYIDAMNLAGEYATAGRDIVLDVVLNILGAKALDTVHNHHNFAWRENHDGEPLWVVRKGATPAFPGQRGFVGGSMGDIAAIVEGQDSPDSETAYRSTVHGAGRLHSRTWAKGKHNRKTGEQKVKGNVTRQMMSEALKEFGGVAIRGGDVDESPFVYRKLEGVLEAQGDTIRVNHTLKPIGVVMAGANTKDPWKD